MNPNDLMAHRDKPIRLLESDGNPWCIATFQYEPKHGKNIMTWFVVLPTADFYGGTMEGVGGLVWPLSDATIMEIKLDNGQLSLVLPRQSIAVS